MQASFQGFCELYVVLWSLYFAFPDMYFQTKWISYSRSKLEKTHLVIYYTIYSLFATRLRRGFSRGFPDRGSFWSLSSRNKLDNNVSCEYFTLFDCDKFPLSIYYQGKLGVNPAFLKNQSKNKIKEKRIETVSRG